jgi:hypothetical protein
MKIIDIHCLISPMECMRESPVGGQRSNKILVPFYVFGGGGGREEERRGEKPLEQRLVKRLKYCMTQVSLRI